MDKKTRPIYMLPRRDPSQIERYTQTKSKGMEKDISCKWKRKKSWGSSTYDQQNRLYFLNFVYLFLERGEGREKEKERNTNCERYIDQLPLPHPQVGTWPTTQECALTGNQTNHLLVLRPVLNPLSHTSQGNKTNFKTKAIVRDKERYCIMIKGTIQQEDITLVNIYAPNIGTPKYVKQTLTDIKGEINGNTGIVRDFNTPLTSMDRPSRQKINKETAA